MASQWGGRRVGERTLPRYFESVAQYTWAEMLTRRTATSGGPGVGEELEAPVGFSDEFVGGREGSL